MNDRAMLLMAGVPKTAKVIEIGPSLNPLAPKRDGWNVTVVDHATREGLIHKYRDEPSVDPKVIEEVDFVWQEGSLADLVGRPSWGTYDAFIASHVIEHTTDLVTFLRAARVLLKNEGVVILALPDKRKCFDFFRPVTTTGDVVEAYLEKRHRHTARTLFDNAAYNGKRNANPGWHIGEQAPIELGGRLAKAWRQMNRAMKEEYVDAHAWTFTPSSFELMILELRALGLLPLSIERCEPATYTEFYAWLRPCEECEDEDTVQRYRLGLLNRIVVEQAESARQVLGSPMARIDDIRSGLRTLADGV